MPLYIVLLGAPGAGKGTQANLISKQLGLPHISSGDIFRENLKNKTELGNQVEGILARGELVPDDITIAMIQDRISRADCAKGAVLDGFPRTPTQAQALDKMLEGFKGKVDIVPYIKVDEQSLVARLSGRWTCRASGHIFHAIFNPPKSPGVCDIDGSELYQREDDQAETVTNRIRVYMDQTSQLIDHYTGMGLLVEIDGAQGIDKVTADLMTALPKG